MKRLAILSLLILGVPALAFWLFNVYRGSALGTVSMVVALPFAVAPMIASLIFGRPHSPSNAAFVLVFIAQSAMLVLALNWYLEYRANRRK